MCSFVRVQIKTILRRNGIPPPKSVCALVRNEKAGPLLVVSLITGPIAANACDIPGNARHIKNVAQSSSTSIDSRTSEVLVRFVHPGHLLACLPARVCPAIPI